MLVLIGIASLIQVVRSARPSRSEPSGIEGSGTEHSGAEPDEHEQDAHGHSHHRSRAPWLILAPAMILVLVAPSALGADAVARNAGSQAISGLDVAPVAATKYDGYAPNDGSGRPEDSSGRRTMKFDPLSAGPNPVLTLKDFVLRSLYDADNSVSATPVSLVGFITPPGASYHGGYTVARLAISCCAADASPIRIHVDGDPPYPVNTWVAVVATGAAGTGGADNDYVPNADVTSVQQVAQPPDPYEH